MYAGPPTDDDARSNASPYRYFDKAEEDAAKEQTKPNPLVCEHGCMRRSCSDCDLHEVYVAMVEIKQHLIYGRITEAQAIINKYV